MRAQLVVLAILVAASPAQGAAGLAPYEAVYHATVKMIPVRARVSLAEGPAQTWIYESRIVPRGWAGFISKELVESSVVVIDQDDRLVSSSYLKQDGFGGRDSDIRFDREAGEMRVRYKGKEHTASWDASIHDMMALRLVLARDLALGRLAETYRMVDYKGRVRNVAVENQGPETLETEAGTLETVRIEYTEARKSRVYRAWLAPRIGGMIVRLEQYEDGDLRGTLELAEYTVGRPETE